MKGFLRAKDGQDTVSTLSNGYNETIAYKKISAPVVDTICHRCIPDGTVPKEFSGGQNRAFGQLNILVRWSILPAQVVCVPCGK